MGRGGCDMLAQMKGGVRSASVPEMKGQRKKRQVCIEELQKHSTVQDCWVAIAGEVYDVTRWLSSHPGGIDVIAVMAGQDATDVFNAFHRPKVWKRLPSFHIGTLVTDPPPKLVSDHRNMAARLEASNMFQTHPLYYIKTFLALGTLLLLAVSGVLLCQQTAVHLASALALGLFWNQCAYIGHDSGHNGITKSLKWDSLIGLLAGNACTGIGITWWKTTHNVHHIVCNSVDYDPDIQHVPLFAISSKYFDSIYSYYHKRKLTFDQVARFLVCYQHLTFYPVMAVARLNLYVQTWLLLLRSKKSSLRTAEIVALMFFFTWFGLLLSALPGWGERLAFFFICHAVTGILHIQICLSHFPMPTFEGRPENNTWAITQMKGTLDIDCPPWMDWFHGGLQFQYEHHLFPRLPRHNLRKVQPLVKALAEKYDCPYVRVSFWEANCMIVRTLYKAAMEARDLSRPAPILTETITWEALNARG